MLNAAVLDAEVNPQNGEGIEQLPLVFVQPLDLDVEHRIRVDDNPLLCQHIGCKLPLLFLLDGRKPLQHL